MTDINNLTYEDLMTPTDPVCPSCGATMILRTTTKFPNPDGSPRKFYGCSNYPECKEIHGAHQSTGEPLGIPADKPTRAARIRAHEAFDRLWKEGHMSRSAAYEWLAQQLGIPEAHMGEMDIDDCDNVVLLCEQELNRLKRFA